MKRFSLFSLFRPRFAPNNHPNVIRPRHQSPVVKGPAQFYAKLKLFTGLSLAIVLSNVLTHYLLNPRMDAPSVSALSTAMPEVQKPSLYLIDKAYRYVSNPQRFEQKVREIAQQLDIPPEWLMAVMYSESRFDANVKNHKGSGATGLIQFMPATAKDMNISIQRLQEMDPSDQMEYVYKYLQGVRNRNGEYDSLTDLYLAILYPRARKQDICYTLYASPSKSYKQNSGLDSDHDGRVTVSDIDRHMEKLYPTAYAIRKDQS